VNKYGALAQKHWQRWLPKRYAALDNPEAFFTELGEHVSDEIATLSDALAGPDQPGEDFMAKVGRLNMARFNAESDVIRQIVLLTPEPGADDDAEEGATP
jgi:hypothetical protein